MKTQEEKTYLEQLLEVLNRDIFQTEMKLTSCEVNLKKLKEERNEILRELSKNEMMNSKAPSIADSFKGMTFL